MNDSIHYPLFFTYKECIAGDGFMAGVVVSGRALMYLEDDEWWMYGVQPAAIAECGGTPREAVASFRERYLKVLFDFASEATRFDAFKAEVERFFNQKDDETAAEWQKAFELIRSGQVVPKEPFSSLPKQAPEARQPEIKVALIEPSLVSPADNMLDRYEIPEQIAA
jgi:hypothetical protein